MKKRGVLLGFALLLVLFLSGCTKTASGIPDPAGDWDTASLSDVGIRPDLLDDLMDAIHKDGYAVDAVLIVRHGKLVYEQYMGMESSDLHPVYSCTKSVVSLLVGIALARGDVKSLDQTVSELLPNLDWDQIASPKGEITLRHLLTMSSGLDWPELDVPYDAASVFDRWVRQGGRAQYVMERDLVQEPGTMFNYNTGGSHVISTILAEQTGQSTSDYARQHLFGPLGIDDYDWPTDSNGVNFGGHGLRLRPRDMAKIGLLALDSGRWQGEQVVPADWLTAATQEQIGVGSRSAYGYHWWIYPGLAPDGDGIEVFGAMGYRGQHIYLIPEKDMVVVFASALDPEQTVRVPRMLLEQYVLPSAR